MELIRIADWSKPYNPNELVYASVYSCRSSVFYGMFLNGTIATAYA